MTGRLGRVVFTASYSFRVNEVRVVHLLPALTVVWESGEEDGSWSALEFSLLGLNMSIGVISRRKGESK